MSGTRTWITPLRRTRDALSRRLGASSFSRGVSALFLSSLFAQSLTLLVSPALTRLYTPRAFGVLAVYSGLLNVLVTLASLQYETAIPIARSNREATDLLVLCAMLLPTGTILLGLAVYLSPSAALAILGLGPLLAYRHFVPFGYLCLGAYGALVAFATRDAAFGTIARTRLSQAATGPATQIILGLLGFGAPGLLLGFILSQSAGVIQLGRHAWARCERPFLSLRRIRAAAHRFRHFPLVTSWGALAEAIGGALALYLLTSVFYSVTITGFLFLTERVVGRPLRLIVSSLSPVMFSEAGRAVRHDPAQMRARFLQVSSRQAVFAFCWILSACVAARWALPILFGPRWGAAAPLFWAVSPWYFCATVSRSVGPMLQVLERQMLNTVPQIAGPACGTMTFLWCRFHGLPGPEAVLSYACSQAIAFASVYVAALLSIEKLKSHPQPADEAPPP